MAAALRAGLLNIFFKSDRALKVIYFTKNTWGGELHSKLKVFLKQQPEALINFKLFEDSLFSSFYSQRDNIVCRFVLMLLWLQQAGLTFKSILLAKSPYIVHLIEIQNESILNKELKRNDVTDVYVCGLCTDICVGKVNIFMMSIKMFLGPLDL